MLGWFPSLFYVLHVGGLYNPFKPWFLATEMTNNMEFEMNGISVAKAQTPFLQNAPSGKERGCIRRLGNWWHSTWMY